MSNDYLPPHPSSSPLPSLLPSSTSLPLSIDSQPTPAPLYTNTDTKTLSSPPRPYALMLSKPPCPYLPIQPLLFSGDLSIHLVIRDKDTSEMMKCMVDICTDDANRRHRLLISQACAALLYTLLATQEMRSYTAGISGTGYSDVNMDLDCRMNAKEIMIGCN